MSRHARGRRREERRVISLPITRHRFWQLVVDGGLSAAAWYLAFRLRFDPKIPPYYQTMFNRTIWIVLLIQLAVFVLFGFYNRWWRYVSTRDMWGAARGVTVACLVSQRRRLLREPGRGRPAAALGRDHGLAAAARLRRRRADARAHADGAAERRAGSSRAARR